MGDAQATKRVSDLIPDDYIADFWQWVDKNDRPRSVAGWSIDDWMLHLFCEYLTTTVGGGQVLHNLSKRQIQKTFDFDGGL